MKPKNNSRNRARILAMQALYQWHFSQTEIKTISEQFCQFNNMKKVDFNFFQELLFKIVENIIELDEIIKPNLDRNIESLNVVELSLIRLGSYEIIHTSTPYKVIVNEAIEICKYYGTDEGHKYINGVLRTIAIKYNKLQ